MGSRRVTTRGACWRMKKALASDEESSRATAARAAEEDMLAKGGLEGKRIKGGRGGSRVKGAVGKLEIWR
jgi:hypothetical protein